MSLGFLDHYESLDVIGNGSFGIIRKVRQKTDGQIFARKELNFERMSERDRKQIVAEVNILKDLHHEHIVRYHDRHVDRDAGILYILMEYCGGGDLSTVIKQAARQNRPIPEDTIWNYFMQILLALNHCHHPNSHAKSSSATSYNLQEAEHRERRTQILHRDLKPDNVFLDENHRVKLGDFGLSKALAQASFANTYVGTPYYMSPELIQEKAYDSKSDIWSLGCLIYELCALKPPFHEAKTHAELAIFVRNGRIPPLPKGYSQALQNVIKAMLNLNPAMRPSAQQLLQHERLELVFKVSETEKILNTVKSHKSAVTAKEKEVAAKEALLRERERELDSVVAIKDHEIAALQQAIASLQAQAEHSVPQEKVEAAIKEAVFTRENELRILISHREEEVTAAIAKREADLMEAFRSREAQVFQAWEAKERELRAEYEQEIAHAEEQIRWATAKHEELQAEEVRLENVRLELEANIQKWETDSKGRKDKTPFEEVKNILEPLGRLSPLSPSPHRSEAHPPVFATPMVRQRNVRATPQSAMKGVIFTATGETLATPAPLSTIFAQSPKVGINFGSCFDQPDGSDTERAADPTPEADDSDEDHGPSPPPSPTSKREKTKPESKSTSTSRRSITASQGQSRTRLRRPSIRRDSQIRTFVQPSVSDPSNAAVSSGAKPRAKRASTDPATVVISGLKSPAQYDLADEENLPSPFLRRNEKPGGAEATKGPGLKAKRTSQSHLLRAVAAANNIGAKEPSTSTVGTPTSAAGSRMTRKPSRIGVA